MWYVFFDTETVSLNNLTLLEIAWVVANGNGKVISERSMSVRMDGRAIDLSNHPNKKRFTSKKISIEGHNIVEVKREMQKMFSQIFYDNIKYVSHNLEFDKSVIKANTDVAIDHEHGICTMSDKRIVDFCAIPLTNGGWAEEQGYDFKPPKLSELHTKLFGREHRSQHTALGDARAVKRCFFKLKKLGVI